MRSSRAAVLHVVTSGEHDALMANWQRLGGYKLASAEETAVWVVEELLMPEGVVTISFGNVRNCAGIQDVAGFERLARKPANIFLDAAASFQDDCTW